MCSRDPCPFPAMFQGSWLLYGDAERGAGEAEQHLGLVITNPQGHINTSLAGSIRHLHREISPK